MEGIDICCHVQYAIVYCRAHTKHVIFWFQALSDTKVNTNKFN